MALEDQSALSTLLDALTTTDDGTPMRRILEGSLQGLIDAEAEHRIGAGLHERSTTRTTHRNGTRDRLVATTAGDAIEGPREDPQDPHRVVLPAPAAPAPAHRPGPCMRW